MRAWSLGGQWHWELDACGQVRRKGKRLIYDPRICVDHHHGPRPERLDPGFVYAANHNLTLDLGGHLRSWRRWIFFAYTFLWGSYPRWGWPSFGQTYLGRLVRYGDWRFIRLLAASLRGQVGRARRAAAGHLRWRRRPGCSPGSGRGRIANGCWRPSSWSCCWPSSSCPAGWHSGGAAICSTWPSWGWPRLPCAVPGWGWSSCWPTGPLPPHVRFAGASNLQSLGKDLFALALAGMWLLDTVLSRRRLERSPLDLPLLLFFVLAAVQALRAPSLLRGALALKILFVYVPVYFLVYHNPPRSRRQLKALLWLLLAVAAVTAVYGLYQYQFLQGVASPTVSIEGEVAYLSRRANQARVLSTFTHSTVFSLYLSLMIVLGLSLLPSAGGAGRLALLAVLALLVAVLPLTLSRVGWVGLGLGLLVLAAVSQRSAYRVLAVLLLLAAGLVLFVFSPEATQETLSWSFTGQDDSFVIRGNLLRWAYVMTFYELPLGCGVGTLPDSADLVQRVTRLAEPPYTCFYRGVPVTSADTVAMAIGVQMGALGYLLFLRAHIVIFWQGVRVYRGLTDPFLKALGAGLLAYLAVMTFSNFFGGSTQAYPVVDLYFWFFVALLLSLGRIQDRFQAQEAAP